MQICSRCRFFLWLLPLLLSTLACNYVTQLILPSTVLTSTPVPSATLPPTASPTPTPEFQAACPSLLSDIVSAATTDDQDLTLFSSRRRNGEEQKLRYAVNYSLKNDELDLRTEVSVPNDFESELNARSTHEGIWNYFAALIPVSERGFLVEFSVMSDGSSNILGGVRRTNEDPNTWMLRVDVLDARDEYELTYTLMHEYGHLLTLESSQLTLDRSVYLDPGDLEVYERAQAACPNYFARDGCSLPDSYLSEFFNRYWSSFFLEWQEIDKAQDDPSYDSMLHDFYRTYADQFLTEYAATSPEEDIAESWAFFILSEKPELDSIAHEKILFFYEYPQLVELRQEILTRLCVEFPQ
jgi:hypothetical protein